MIAVCSLVAALALTLAAAAQKLPPPPDLSHPPAIGPVQPYVPPVVHRDQLPNGLRIVVVEDHRFPLVTIELALRAGATRLTPASAGLAQAEADLLTAGTPTRTSLQIAQDADALGGSISASVDSDFLTLAASALSTRLQPLVALVADVALHPAFPESEVALEKNNLLQTLRADRADPNYLASVQFAKLLFGDNPYAITAPTENSIAAISRQALATFHQQYFLPNNQAEIVVVGDVAAARAHNLVQQYFGDWRIGSPVPPPMPPVTPPNARRIYLVDRPGSAQSVILLGSLGLTRTAPGYFPFLVANEVLGGSFNSRLMADIRERKGYTYGIYSGNQPYRDLGAWSVQTQVRTAVTAPALAETFKQLERMRAAPASEQELLQAKNYLAGNFVLGLQSQDALASEVITTGLYGLPPDRLATWVSDVQAVDADTAFQAAQAIIHPQHSIVVVVGDVQQIEAPLAQLVPGTVLPIFNAEGRQIGTFPSTPAAGH
ncbi:MAG: M16 family metallopeptidase [Terriglobales bacterium]